MKKQQPLIAIVTPVFNELTHLKIFLRALKRQTYRNVVPIIIDAGSSDGSGEYLRKAKGIEYIEGTPDWWWSHSTNKGVEHAKQLGADYVLTINVDVDLDKDYLAHLVKATSISPRALVGSLVVYRDKPEKVWYAGGTFDDDGMTGHVMGKVSDFHEPIRAKWLTGMGTLVPIAAYDKAGQYDEKHFPQYFGDADLSLRAAKAGYELWVDPKSVVIGDVKSNWVGRQMAKPKARFYYDLFFSIRSPYQIKTRYWFYRRHWPTSHRKALWKFYTGPCRYIAVSFTKRLLTRKSN